MTTGQELNRPTTLTTDSAVLHPPAKDTILSFGDTLTFRLFGDPDYTPIVTIGADGNVVLPYIGIVHMAGLNIYQAEQLVDEKLIAAGMYVHPEVSITFTPTNNSVTLIGEVHGVVPIVGTRRLLDVLAANGGLPSTASHVVVIHRPGVPEPIVVEVSTDPLNIAKANVPILAGDTIVTSRVGLVYVFGAFKTTGTITLNSYGPLTLMQLTALSGGVSNTAKYSDLRIIRTIGNRRTVSVFDLKKVLTGKAPDPILQPNDIVYLQNSNFKSVFLGGGLGTALGLASIAITLANYR
jgi:polysaccharide export outer membrane protein